MELTRKTMQIKARQAMGEAWMRGWTTLETAPFDEPCAQVGIEDYELIARDEAKRHIDLIRRIVGKEPEGIRLKVRSNPHDFGSYVYIEVNVREDDEEALAYARRLEDKAPARWDKETA